MRNLCTILVQAQILGADRDGYLGIVLVEFGRGSGMDDFGVRYEQALEPELVLVQGRLGRAREAVTDQLGGEWWLGVDGARVGTDGRGGATLKV